MPVEAHSCSDTIHREEREQGAFWSVDPTLGTQHEAYYNVNGHGVLGEGTAASNWSRVLGGSYSIFPCLSIMYVAFGEPALSTLPRR
jgi:hypothetical protein